MQRRRYWLFALRRREKDRAKIVWEISRPTRDCQNIALSIPSHVRPFVSLHVCLCLPALVCLTAVLHKTTDSHRKYDYVSLAHLNQVVRLKVMFLLLPWLWHMIFTFNSLPAMVVTYSHAKGQGQRSVSSKDRDHANGRTSKRTWKDVLHFTIVKL